MLSTSAEIPGTADQEAKKTAFGDRFGVLTAFVCVSGKNGIPQREETDQAGRRETAFQSRQRQG